MGRLAPSSSPRLGRKRTAAPTPDPPTPRRYCSMVDVTHRAHGGPSRAAVVVVARAQAHGGAHTGSADAASLLLHGRCHAPSARLFCDTCGSGERDDDLLLCNRCERSHHTFCLRPIAAKVPIGPICPVCAPPAKAPKNQNRQFLPDSEE